MAGYVAVYEFGRGAGVEVSGGAASFVHVSSQCTITGDVRLDNRDELAQALGIDGRLPDPASDAAVVLEAYLAWDTRFLGRLRGDFAFGIWDPRDQLLLCVRDQMGVRQFSYHHSPGRIFAFAAGAAALVRHPQVPNEIDEHRIADYLVGPLEGLDKTSTFFRGVARLPPAHAIAVRRGGITTWRYWTPDRAAPLSLPSDNDYADAFCEAFTLAVQTRLRGPGPPASMLSGGIDSGAIVALGRGATEGRKPLMTFSAVSSLDGTDAETRAIRASLTMDGIEAHILGLDDLDAQDLVSLAAQAEEPFDGSMTLPRAIYRLARRNGVTTLLDGASADTILAPGRHVSRLLRRGHVRQAYHEARAQDAFWGGSQPVRRELGRAARAAFVPNRMLEIARVLRRGPGRTRIVRASVIDPAFAARVDVQSRLRQLLEHEASFDSDPWTERVSLLEHPYLVVGRERYDRVSAAIGVRAADPYLDLRVVSLCLRLPDDQLARDGWSKLVARHATGGFLPDEVRWRRGREHLGWAYTSSILDGARQRILGSLESNLNLLDPYVDSSRVRSLLSDFDMGDATTKELAYTLFCLGEWLRRHVRADGQHRSVAGGET